MNMKPGEHEFLSDTAFDIAAAGKCGEIPDWARGRQPVAHHILFYPAKGDGKAVIDETEETLVRDAIYLHAPGTKVELRPASRSGLELYWVAFDLFRVLIRPDGRRELEREAGFPVAGCIRMGGSRVVRTFQLLLEAGENRPERNRFVRQQYLYDLLDELLFRASAGFDKERGGDWLKRSIQYMQSHYREEIRIERLAELAQLHPTYFSQMFKKTMDLTPVSFLTNLRMNKAKEMLLQTDRPIREIARDVGYGDEFYFSRRFKKTNGLSPTVFTKKSDLKIASLSAPFTDHLFTLGIEPCAAQTHPFLPLKTTELALPNHASDPWEISRRAFLDVKPDLIVCKNNVSSKAKEHVNDIAPIISIPWTTKDIYTHLTDIADLVNRRHKAQQWLDGYERKSERLRREVWRSVGQATLALCAVRKSGIRMYGDRNIGHVFYRSLRLSPPEKVARQMETSPPGTGFNWMPVAPEELADYEADFLFFIPETPEDARTVDDLLRTHPAWKRHSAIRSRRFGFLNWSRWIVYAPFMIDRQLDEAASLFSRPLSPASEL